MFGGLGYDEYMDLCDGLSLPCLCETYFKNIRTKTLKKASKIYKEEQEPLFQEVTARLGDVYDHLFIIHLIASSFPLIFGNIFSHFSLDGTFSHKRHGNFCMTTLVASQSLLVPFSQVKFSQVKINTKLGMKTN